MNPRPKIKDETTNAESCKAFTKIKLLSIRLFPGTNNNLVFVSGN